MNDQPIPRPALLRISELESENAKLRGLAKIRNARISRLKTALRDCISTYDPNRAETFVSAERQEAWQAALDS